MPQWYCYIEGEQKGPYEESDLENLARLGFIKPDTMVRREEDEPWQSVMATELAHLFPVVTTSQQTSTEGGVSVSPNDPPNTGTTPPPLPKENTSPSKTITFNLPPSLSKLETEGKYAWAIVGIYALYLIFYILFSSLSTLVFSSLGIILLIGFYFLAKKDIDEIERNGAVVKRKKLLTFAVLLTPVYLYMRATASGQKRHPFYACMGLIAIGVIVTAITLPNQIVTIQIEETAPGLVNQIIAENVPNAAECEKVKITEKISDRLYKARAYFDNGNVMEINIKKNGDYIEVEIPWSQFF